MKQPHMAAGITYPVEVLPEPNESSGSVPADSTRGPTNRGGGKGVTAIRPAPPDPEVQEKPRRRRFTAAYKLRILREVEAHADTGEVGALLRREGLYASHLTTWRRQREEGALECLAPKTRGRKAQPRSPLARRIAELERDKQQLEHRLKQAELMLEVQKKVSARLGMSLRNADNGGHT